MVMQKTQLRFLAVAALALIAAGCANVTGSSTNANMAAARDLAMSVADPTSGTTQEMADLGAFLFGPGALGPQPWSLFHSSDFALYLMDGVLSGKFVWNPSNNDYELSQTNTITAGPISGTATVSISLAFFTSADATGTGVQITIGQPIPSTIHSLTYNRSLSGSFSNSLVGIERQLTSTSSFTVTGLNGTSAGFTVNGTKNVSFTNSYSDGRSISGTLTENVNNVVVTAVLQSDGSYLVSATGTILVDYSATLTSANGTTQQVIRTATITLNGQQMARVDMDGTEVDVDVTTGETD
jgi:hypothetical protein